MHPTVIPTMRYPDADAAIEWLCQALGFEEHFVVRDENGLVVHAQLTFGNGMIMLGETRDDALGRAVKSPEDLDGFTTQGAYLIVDDVTAHYDRAVAAGAEILVELKDEEYGRNYSCRDPQGHVWNFGDYDPWA